MRGELLLTNYRFVNIHVNLLTKLNKHMLPHMSVT